MKSTRLDAARRRIHIWHDGPLNFHAEAVKFDGEWFVECGPLFMVFTNYQAVTDWVLDTHRLAKAGLDSWDSHAAALAGNDGKDWESLSDTEKQDYIDNARMNARMEATS